MSLPSYISMMWYEPTYLKIQILLLQNNQEILFKTYGHICSGKKYKFEKNKFYREQPFFMWFAGKIWIDTILSIQIFSVNPINFCKIICFKN